MFENPKCSHCTGDCRGTEHERITSGRPASNPCSNSPPCTASALKNSNNDHKFTRIGNRISCEKVESYFCKCCKKEQKHLEQEWKTVEELKSIFPQFDADVIEAVLITSNGDRGLAIKSLFSRGSDNE